MKNYSLNPTEENALDLLRTNPIGRTEDVLRLLSTFQHGRRLLLGCAEWGVGVREDFLRETS